MFYFSHHCEKRNPWGKQLKGGKIYSGLVIGRGYSIMEGKVWLQSMDCLVSYITQVVKKQRDDVGRAGDISHQA